MCETLIRRYILYMPNTGYGENDYHAVTTIGFVIVHGGKVLLLASVETSSRVQQDNMVLIPLVNNEPMLLTTTNSMRRIQREE